MRILNLCMSTLMVSGTATLLALSHFAPSPQSPSIMAFPGLTFAEATPQYVHDYDDAVMGVDAVAVMMAPAPQDPQTGLAAAVLSQLGN